MKNDKVPGAAQDMNNTHGSRHGQHMPRVFGDGAVRGVQVMEKRVFHMISMQSP